MKVEKVKVTHLGAPGKMRTTKEMKHIRNKKQNNATTKQAAKPRPFF